ncbi:putative beta-1,3-galactosyl-O-glycosyl-glycoprotein beta-1,6-N-acetylglucosaminyltransferase 7 [Ascaphus truei]|uniref:putative beta-1,3-galactosyl-O-glycosyl-glycoprotein beta-1,6-N-acetylglucosaminyltransferase 7 n=1 Tax=Ascaphus truei TaxID=8439 RepID=UPI003F59AE37
MSRFGITKSGFILCVGVGVFLFAFIDKNSDGRGGEKFVPEIKECGFYPEELCTALFKGKSAAPSIGNVCQASIPPPRGEGPVCLQHPTNCSKIIMDLHFITKPLSAEEANFSLAYILTIHKDLDMFVKLITAIYAPQNIYCIHIDEKSPKAFERAVRKLASCFQNMFISSKQVSVVYAGFSRLQADLNCMEDLVRSNAQWSYVLNLCGQDFPIKTNKEIIQYLKSKWNGKNLTPGVTQPPHIQYRTRVSYKEFVHLEKSYVYPTTTEKHSPPHNITLYFGTAYYALTLEFVNFVLSDTRARDLLQWSRDTYSPDEHYWVTLNRLKDAPGATPDAQWEGNIRAIKWKDQEGSSHSGCHGHYVRNICVYGLGDLQWLTKSPHLFANKFDLGRYPLVLDCLERHYRLKVLKQAEVVLEPHWYFQADQHFNMNKVYV